MRCTREIQRRYDTACVTAKLQASGASVRRRQVDNRGAIAAACIISLGLCISVSIHSFGDRIQNYFFPVLRVYAPPTAAEVFEMRSKCAARVEVVLESVAVATSPTGGELAQYGISKYDSKTNRCFVDIHGRTTGEKDNLFIERLYDGQTLEMLADSYRYRDEKNKHKDIAISNMSHSLSVDDVRDEINAIMKDDRKQ